MRHGLARFALGFVVACGSGADALLTPASTVTAGDTLTDAAGWVEYVVGDAPLVIVAPHGGLLEPASLPDRTCAGCVTGTDDNTQDLARRVVDQFRARTGRRPHLVVSRLRRAKFDPNRELPEATGGLPALTPTWLAFHTFIETARGRVTTASRRGLLLDLHGHAHAIARLELGYLVSAAALRGSDQALAASNVLTSSSIARLMGDATSHPAPVVLLRGAPSLGGLLERNGFPTVPSPGVPAPAAADEYFTGGYITERHGSSGGGTMDAIQIEAYRAGARDTPENLDKYAAAIVSSAIEYLGLHYGWTPSAFAGAVASIALPWPTPTPGVLAWH